MLVKVVFMKNSEKVFCFEVIYKKQNVLGISLSSILSPAIHIC